MDTTETTHISLCSGYGGIDLGLKRVIPNLRTVAYAEIEAFACENLLARMEGGQLDAAPIWSDLKTFPWAEFSGLVDILSGGYPCQPFSAAGKRSGKNDPRHLWPYIAEGIRILQPTVCLFENVEGHITLGLSSVVSDLEEMGYKVSWGIFSAAEVGAPHQRKRVFILAVSSGFRGATRLSGSLAGNEGITGIANDCGHQDIWPSRPGEPQHAWEPPRVIVADPHKYGDGASVRREARQGFEKLHNESTGMGNAESGARFGRASRDEGHAAQPDESVGDASLLNGSGQAGGQRQAQAGRADTARYDRQTESSLGGDADGSAGGLDYAELCVTCDNRTDELRLLGNGVVPATAALAFRTLLKELTQ